jgi:hypothetical protein
MCLMLGLILVLIVVIIIQTYKGVDAISKWRKTRKIMLH